MKTQSANLHLPAACLNLFIWSALALTILTTGCASVKVQAPSTDRYANYRLTRESAGLAVAVHPLSDGRLIKETFGTDLLAGNVLPIFVSITNRNATESFLLAREQLALGVAEATSSAATADKKPKTTGAGEAVALTGAAIGAPVMMLAGLKVLTDSMIINHQYAIQQLQTKMLSPGQDANGFVYFQIPKKSVRPAQWTFVTRFKNSRSDEEILLTFPFTLNNK